MTCILVSRSIGGVFVDVVISEEHESSMTIAEHPVEKGVKISDHAWRERRRVTLEGVVEQGRAISSYQQLLDVQELAEPFDLVTGLMVYPNMLIERITVNRDKEHARLMKFEAECSEVQIVSTEGAASSGDDKAQSTTKRGQVAARESSPPPKTMSTIEAAVAK
jgi:hypothetical protein